MIVHMFIKSHARGFVKNDLGILKKPITCENFISQVTGSAPMHVFLYFSFFLLDLPVHRLYAMGFQKLVRLTEMPVPKKSAVRRQRAWMGRL